MKASYRQLIGEHEAIETAASNLLADLGSSDVDGRGLAAQLADLARVVEDHIEVEDAVVAGFDPNRLSGPWTATWHEGLAAFDRLKADWIAFLGRWDRMTIDRDRQGFHHAAEAILGRLRQRLELETRAFYATALQTGAIELR